ncbi:MAG: sugar-binding domain-containing protein [Thermoanaerobaculia bacterium]|nr:sugar-binding domain-containing protein [Thermoanaerobaculia bacterium]
MSSAEARTNPSGALLRFVRDHARDLRRFKIYATRGTAEAILQTGLIPHKIVTRMATGAEGGVAAIAAMVAKQECAAVFLLLDPTDLRSDVPEIRALKRVCIAKNVRLLATQAGAERWAVWESSTFSPVLKPDASTQYLKNVPAGHPNVKGGSFESLEPTRQTLALISHDNKKVDMLRFVKEQATNLRDFSRILATGTTGWLVKLLVSEPSSRGKRLREMSDAGTEKARVKRVVVRILAELTEDDDLDRPERERNLKAEPLESLLEGLAENLEIEPDSRLAERLFPLASGPDGGDVLIALEVLEHTCHTIVFFHDPKTAHPHEADIRLLERTCQLDGVYAVCVSDYESARQWAETVGRELAQDERGRSVNMAQQVRERYASQGLREVVVVGSAGDSDEEGDRLGRNLAHACAGYFHQRLLEMAARRSRVIVGVAWGQVMRWMVEELKEMIETPPKLGEAVLFAPLIGLVAAEEEQWEASDIARDLADFYSAGRRFFGCAGYRVSPELPEDARQVVEDLKQASLIVSSAGPWSRDAVRRFTRLDPEKLPDDGAAVGMIGSVIIKKRGREQEIRYTLVGLDHSGLKAAARNGAVIVTAGGRNRRDVVRAALEGSLVSTLITTHNTAAELLAG